MAGGWFAAVVRVAGAVLAVCLPTAALADPACPARTVDALAAADLIPAGDDTGLVAQACRIWPYDASLALTALAYRLPDQDNGYGRPLRLLIALQDAHDARPLATREIDLEEDAAFELGADGLRLDTARYDLAPGVRAFGVVVRNASRNPSCPEGRVNDELTLYVRDDSALRPVFSTHLEVWAQLEGEACTGPAQRLVTEQATVRIGLEPANTRGYADLRVMADIERLTREPGEHWHDPHREHRRRSRVVRYDGERYDTRTLPGVFSWPAAPTDE